MKRNRARLAAVVGTIISAVVLVGGGSAGNRDLVATFEAVPAPGSVTYGQTIAYVASLDNNTKANFTHVEFRQSRPTATFGGQTVFAEFVDSSCGAYDDKGDTDPANDEVVCVFGELRPDDPAEELTTVWTAPTISSTTGCADCLDSDGTWFIKEGKPTNANETRVIHEDVQLLGNDGTDELLKASSYELPRVPPTECTPANANLSTNQALSKDNPVSSFFCLPSFAPDATHLGLAATITELKGNPRQAEVCIAELGETTCGGTTYIAKNFGPGKVTYVFHIFNPGIKGPISEVRHNGELLTSVTCGRAVNPECLVSLTYDSSTQTWTIIATSWTNGPYSW